MKPQTKVTLPLFELAGMLALFLTGWVAARLYEITPKVDQDRGQLAGLRDAFLGLSEAVKTNFNRIDEDLRDALRDRDSAAQTRFHEGFQEWMKWLDRERKRTDSLSQSETTDFDRQDPPASAVFTSELAPVRQELLSLLSRASEASSNYFAEAQYLTNSAGKPLLGKRLAERELVVRSWWSNLMALGDQADARGKAINVVLADRERRSQALNGQIQRLRLGLALAVLGLFSLFLLRRQRLKQAEADAAIRLHAEQQAKLDRLAYFSSQMAQEHAHEIKQPLTAINAYLYTLQKSLADGSSAHKDAAVIRREINRLDQIVEKFLQQARSTDFQPVGLTAEQVIGDVRDLMECHLKDRAIELRCEVDPKIRVSADPRQLKQVLINLVKNAAESIAREGVITLRAKAGPPPHNGTPATAALIEVEDTGGGIPPEIQKRIFDPFFSTKTKGSGLGLAISARIIQRHGGRLEFDSHVGQGTIFRIMLPAVETNQSHEQSPAHR